VSCACVAELVFACVENVLFIGTEVILSVRSSHRLSSSDIPRPSSAKVSARSLTLSRFSSMRLYLYQKSSSSCSHALRQQTNYLAQSFLREGYGKDKP
jgi:hypothetical protein